MSNIEDDIKILKDKDCLWIYSEDDILKAQEHILSEREQDKERIKELEEKNNEMKNLFRIQASIAKELDFKEEEKMIRVRGMYYVPDTMTITDNIGKPKRIELSYVDVTKLLGEL